MTERDLTPVRNSSRRSSARSFATSASVSSHHCLFNSYLNWNYYKLPEGSSFTGYNFHHTKEAWIDTSDPSYAGRPA